MSVAIEKNISWSYEFPNSPDFSMPVMYAELTQRQAAHDILVIQFKGSLQRHTKNIIENGDPIKFTWSSGIHKCVFVGFVHSIEKNTTPANSFTRVICVNNSELLKKSSKELFKNLSADKIVAQIASENRFTSQTTTHPYTYPRITQAGQSYWQLLKRLSNATGYALRVENTEIIFKNQDQIIADKLSDAPIFEHYNMVPVGLAAHQTLMSFTALDSKNSPEINRGDMGVSVSGVDGSTYTFNKSRSVSNGESFMNPVKLPSDWLNTYGVVSDTTIDGFGG